MSGERAAQTIKAYKDLRLITSDLAQEFGILAEVPVFISPSVLHKAGKYSCRECGTDYKPLTYQVGYVVTTDHYHKNYQDWLPGMEESRGGIDYYLSSVIGDYGYRRAFGGCWAAVLDPLGETHGQSVEKLARSVYARGIIPQCALHHGEELKEGYLVEYNASRSDSNYHYLDMLLPSCRPSSYKQFGFQVAETGEVLFYNL